MAGPGLMTRNEAIAEWARKVEGEYKAEKAAPLRTWVMFAAHGGDIDAQSMSADGTHVDTVDGAQGRWVKDEDFQHIGMRMAARIAYLSLELQRARLGRESTVEERRDLRAHEMDWL